MNKFCSALLVGNLMSQTLVCSVYFILIVRSTDAQLEGGEPCCEV